MFWTGLFTFGGGVVGGTAGYVSARLQRRFQEQQLGLERRRYESEESRVDRQGADQRREQGRAIYLAYLEAVDTITNSATADVLDDETLSERWKTFVKAGNKLELAGTEGLRNASYQMDALLNRLVTEFSAIIHDSDRTWPGDANEFMHGQAKEVVESRNEMVSLMRRDLQNG